MDKPNYPEIQFWKNVRNVRHGARLHGLCDGTTAEWSRAFFDLSVACDRLLKMKHATIVGYATKEAAPEKPE